MPRQAARVRPGGCMMHRHPAHIRLVVLMCTSLTWFEGSAFAQGPRSSDVASEEPRPSDLQTEVDRLRAENALVRELLRQVEARQEALLQQVDRLQGRLDGVTTAVVQPSGPSPVAQAAEPSARVANNPAPNAAAAAGQPASSADHYQDGIIIWQNPEDAKVPFLLRFNNNTQIRYLNTTDSADTFTDHLGVVRDVHTRNDITVNRSMFIFAGYMFDPRLQYSLTVWTSAGAASIVVARNIGWRFNKGLTLTGGYTGVPGSRSLVATFPFFQPTDRSMADNFFRPGFTQGVWANGEP